MDAAQKERAEAMKSVVYFLTQLCDQTKVQLERENAPDGDAIRAAEWHYARLRSLRALAHVHKFCGLVYWGGIEAWTMVDVMKFSSELKQFESEPMTRQ